MRRAPAAKPNKLLYALLACFFVSGFCALLYQSIWLRLAFAAFGINAQIVSVVLSVFMAGLALGSLSASRLKDFFNSKTKVGTLRLYAAAELFIGLGSIIVPKLFDLGKTWLLGFNQTSSLAYLLLSAIVLFLSILPWSFVMGTTIPLMMSVLKERSLSNERSFSLLYAANTAGALLGVSVSVFVLVELLGFKGTLLVAGGLNLLIAVFCFALAPARRPVKPGRKAAVPIKTFHIPVTTITERKLILPILFFTGFSSIGLEVIWTRLFTPILSTTVYAFAIILFLYLIGTVFGVRAYRRAKSKTLLPTSLLVWLIALISIAQIAINDPRLNLGVTGIAISVSGFALLLGYLTPKQVDQYSGGNPHAAGRAYAVNAAGCIFGPLAVAYLFLPWVGARASILIISVPFLVFGTILLRKSPTKIYYKAATFGIAILLIVVSLVVDVSYEEGPIGLAKTIKRDYSATVIAYGSGLGKGLIVNGVNITTLRPVTKIMAHLPLVLHQGKPNNVLIICFGMGTTFRSSLSWGVNTTAVELSPSVPKLFPYFFSDAQSVLNNPKGKIVIDDGRRYLQRGGQQYDVITLDPPPPTPAAGSSLLYSREFYEVAKSHLAKNGILQQWYPGIDNETLQAVARSLTDEFKYVKVYRSTVQPYMSQNRGFHFLASMQPIPDESAAEAVAKMPAAAQKDLLEWQAPGTKLQDLLSTMLASQVSVQSLLNPNKNIVVTDDHPFNEYYLLRLDLHNQY